MKRLMIAVLVALVGIAALGAVASAAPNEGPGQRGQPDGARVRLVSARLDMTPRALLAALRDGRTVADLAAERDVPLEEIADAVAAPRRERLARAVEANVLTRAQADYLNARADERLDDFLTQPIRRAVRAEGLEDLATVLGTREEEIVAQIEGGATLEEIVTGEGMSVEAVVAEMVALRDADLSEVVALDLMTETQKRVALARYEARLTRLLTGDVLADRDR